MPEEEIRRSPVDTAERLAEIRWRAWSKGWLPPTSTVAFLLDHIDTLTARLHGAEQGEIEMAEKVVALTTELAECRQGEKW